MDDHPLPFSVRMRDCIGAWTLWRTGMYNGGKFNRDQLDALSARMDVHAGYDKANDVLSVDIMVDSYSEKDLKIPVRVFTSAERIGERKTLPILIFIHGGG